MGINNYATPASDLAKVAEIASAYKGQKDQLMQVLLEAQKVAGNALPGDVAAVISKELGVPQNQIYGFITFYSMFSDKVRGKYVVRICRSTPCHVRGALDVVKAMEEALGIKMGETTQDGLFTLEYTECLGICDVAPAIMINDDVHGNLTPESVKDLIMKYKREDVK